MQIKQLKQKLQRQVGIHGRIISHFGRTIPSMDFRQQVYKIAKDRLATNIWDKVE